MDPRVKTPAAVIAQTHAMSLSIFDAIARDSAITAEARAIRDQLRTARTAAPSLADQISALDDRIVALVGQGGGGGRRGGGGGGRGRGGAPGGPTFTSIDGTLQSSMNLLEESDAEPTTQATASVQAARRDFDALVARWNVIRTTDIPALNAKLRAAGQSEIRVP